MGRGTHRWWVVLGVTVALSAVTVGAGWAIYLNHQIDDVRRVEVDLGPEDRSAGSDEGSRPGPGEPVPGDGRSDPEEAADAGRSRAVTILVAGVDAGDAPRIAESMAAGDWPRGVYRTDTLMVAHLTPNRRRAYVVSIPRDTWVDVEGYGKRKLNAAFSLGGPSLAVDTVQRFARVDLDHLMIVDWKAFKRLTVAVGGVEVHIPRDVFDPSQGVRWKAGTHRLKGQRALQYVRQRHGLPGGDLSRMHRQQNFIRATLQKLMSDGTMQNPVRLTRVLEAVTDHLVVDDGLSSDKLRDLALSARELSADKVRFLTVPTKGIDRVDGRSVVVPDRRRTRRLFDALEAGRMGRYLRNNQADLLPEEGGVR